MKQNSVSDQPITANRCIFTLYRRIRQITITTNTPLRVHSTEEILHQVVEENKNTFRNKIEQKSESLGLLSTHIHQYSKPIM